jgi:hypothetical protein
MNDCVRAQSEFGVNNVRKWGLATARPDVYQRSEKGYSL